MEDGYRETKQALEDPQLTLIYSDLGQKRAGFQRLYFPYSEGVGRVLEAKQEAEEEAS